MNYVQVHPDFPVLLLANYSVVDERTRKALMDVVLENRTRNCRPEFGFNFLIDRDYNYFFQLLYRQFLSSAREIFGDIRLLPANSTNVWSYASNRNDHASDVLHNHLHSATINAVYYLNIPSSTTVENGSITFALRDKAFSYRPNNFDLVLFPSYLEHKINYLDDEDYRISINMEILCEPVALPGWQASVPA